MFVVGQPALLSLTLSDGAAGLFPRATVVDATGAPVGSPIALSPVGGSLGLYFGLWTPATAGRFQVFYEVFTDAGFTIPAVYDKTSEVVEVSVFDNDNLFRRLLGHAGENARDDVLTYDTSGRPLTLRRRIFATAAAAAASTPGGTGEGEIATLTGTAAYPDASRWSTLLRTVPP